jgi:hypothetical protein
MILRLLKGRGMVSGLFEKERDAIPTHPAPLQALHIYIYNKGDDLTADLVLAKEGAQR